MADDKKNIPETAQPAETPAPTVENVAVPEQPAPEPVLTDAEAVMLEHEGQAALFEMGEAVPDPADAVTHAEVEEPAAPEAPKAEMEQAQPPDPGKDAPAPAHSGKVVDFAAARDEAVEEEKKAVKQKPPNEKNKPVKPSRGRPPKEGKAAPDKAKSPKPRDKKSQSKPIPEKPAVDKGGAPTGAEVTPEPSAPRDATRAEKEEIVYLNLSDLHPFKNHPFGVRDDAEMQGLVESVKAAGVNQPALVRPREDGGYEIIAGHRRQRASELAGFANMPCIVRNMTDDEAILAMTDDNLRHRERILPTEKAQSLKMQVEAIKHQGSRPGEEDKDAGKRSTQVVGDRNGMNYKQVQRYIRLTELVPDLQKMVDEKKLAFTPAVEISFIRPKNQRYIAVSIEGQQSSPSLSQAQKMRELDKDGKLNGDVIDGILSQEKKEVDKGDHTSSVADIINLVHNLDCYSLHPGVTDDETLGRIYVEDMELLDVPDNVLPYFDFEAYGRDMRINEGGHFAPTGYLTRSGDFKEVYHGIEDIPAEHRIFAYPKLNIREQMAAYKEVIDRSSLEGERLHPRKEHDDR